MSKQIILAFVVKNLRTKAISVLSLTSEYKFMLVQPNAGSTADTIIEVSKSGASEEAVIPLPVDSLTVIYGENGQGKTSLLLDICRTLAFGFQKRPLGVIWRGDRDQLYLDQGSQFTRMKLVGPTATGRARYATDIFGTLFYTTSPFESARRRALAAEGTLDVSPSFGVTSFNGTSLCQAASALPQDIEFIRGTNVKVEIRLPSLRRLLKDHLKAFAEDKARSVTLENLSAEVVGLLSSLPKTLSPSLKMAFAIELERARLQGPNHVMDLIRELIEGKILRTNEDAEAFLNRRFEYGLNRIPAQAVHHAIEIFRKKVPTAVRRQGLFIDYVKLLGSIPQEIWAALQEAEELGVLRWSFLDLSSGQVALLMLFSSVSSGLSRLAIAGRQSVILVIDEGEMFMHPTWQRQYLSDLMRFISHYRERFLEIHLVLATHSLIVAGDAPPSRLFDVMSGEMKNGFALGAMDTLTKVYGVEDFSGKLTGDAYTKVAAYLRDDKSLIAKESEARNIVQHMASSHLKAYLLEELERHAQRKKMDA